MTRRPVFALELSSSRTPWGLISQVSRCLKQHGFEARAREFRGRALALDVDDEDTVELLDLILEYVEVV